MTQGNIFDHAQLSFPFAKQKIFGIVTAEWNQEITFKLRDAAIELLKYFEVPEAQIISHIVPGSFELPLGAQWLASKGNVDAVLCFGCVIQGDTRHFDYVCQAATDGIMQTGLKYNKPVIFGLLTTNNQAQAEDRAGGKYGNKGTEAAITALKMLAIQNS
jgi:6,7-dimethyl-8-ribityllumazine synthase